MGNHHRGSAMICCAMLLALFCLLVSTQVGAWDEGINKGAMERGRAKSCGGGGNCLPPESNKYNRGCHAEERCRDGGAGRGEVEEGIGRKLEEETDVTMTEAASDDDDDDDDTFKPATASFSGGASFESSFIVMGH
uniref:Uncharacterized protein n=1 Tax=Kalanchoe fedtschenkoi TaxID=63787 RepID=A0A7N0RIR1_KALFE